MNAVVKRLPGAQADILKTAQYHDDHEPGLGEQFIREIDRIITSLTNTALLHRIRYADVRWARFKKFRASGAFYFVRNNRVIGLTGS